MILIYFAAAIGALVFYLLCCAAMSAVMAFIAFKALSQRHARWLRNFKRTRPAPTPEQQRNAA